MQFEFNEMEKYWMNKLASERSFYEEHIQQNETKFQELQQQIKYFVNHLAEGKSGEDSVANLTSITE